MSFIARSIGSAGKPAALRLGLPSAPCGRSRSESAVLWTAAPPAGAGSRPGRQLSARPGAGSPIRKCLRGDAKRWSRPGRLWRRSGQAGRKEQRVQRRGGPVTRGCEKRSSPRSSTGSRGATIPMAHRRRPARPERLASTRCRSGCIVRLCMVTPCFEVAACTGTRLTVRSGANYFPRKNR